MTQKSHVIYKFSWKRGNCAVLNQLYISMMITKLFQQLTFHLGTGAPHNHPRETHGAMLTRSIFKEFTKILDTCRDERRLQILEALYIKETSPKLNKQMEVQQTLLGMQHTANTTPATLTDSN